MSEKDECKGALLDDPTWQPTCALCNKQKDRAEFLFYPAYNEFVCNECEKGAGPDGVSIISTKLGMMTGYKPITDKEIEELEKIDKENERHSAFRKELFND